MPVPNTFANATATIPLSQLDANFATTITLGNTAIQLGNTVSTLNNMTLANVTISSGNVTITNVTVTTANVTTANIATATIATANVSGNLTFTGTGNRILGDFTNATIADRVMFQTSTVNNFTSVEAIPNGTGTLSQFTSYAQSDPTNASLIGIRATAGTDARILSSITGTGTYLPMTFHTFGSEKFRIAADATGTYTFGGTAPRITGDFSTNTIANRVAFQTSTVNGISVVSVIPNGTGTATAFHAFNNSDPTNAARAVLQVTNAEVVVSSGITGTGTYLPMTFVTGGSERLRVDTSGNVGIGTSSPGSRLQINTAAAAATAVTITDAASYTVKIGYAASGVGYIGGDTGSAFALYSNNTERARIDGSGYTQFSSNLVMPYQGAPTSKAGAATLTGAELVTGILNTTGTTYTITLPTGTNIEGALTWAGNNVSLDWTVINTASGTITIGANGNTTLGSLTIATGTSAGFRIRRTAANTFTVYRMR